ncbi:hypothetical protein Q5752_002211 [Cryptotrichosporon argae]
MSRQRAWLLLALSLTIHLSLSRLSARSSLSTEPALVSRALDTRSLPASYADWYFSAPTTTRPFILLALVGLLAFLFTFIGITASDFFCPNLSTVAVSLGLSESTAGVTFLAFGNGSPDVFSTFAAVQGGTFGLAVGELIGAASFITSIVVGSIALVRPFHVPRHAFVRDITFFTSAVVVLIATLHDGRLSLVESLSMVALYAAYVAVVVAGNWVSKRRARKRAHTEAGDGTRETAGDGGLAQRERPSRSLSRSLQHQTSLPHLAHHPSHSHSRAHSSQHFPLPLPDVEAHPHPHPHPHSHAPRRPGRARSHTSASLRPHSPSRHNSDGYEYETPRATFSLLGAVEFRDVVNSLRREGSPGLLTPEGDYFSQRRDYVRRRTSLAAVETASATGSEDSATPIEQHEPNPWTDQQGKPPTPAPSIMLRVPSPRPPRPHIAIPDSSIATRRARGPDPHPQNPAISVTDPTGHERVATPPATSVVRTARSKLRTVLSVLFPSLQSFRHKSVLGMVLAVLSAPAILALTLTLPVVDDGQGEGGVALSVTDGEPLVEDGEGECEDEDASAELDGDDCEEGDARLSAAVGEELHHLLEGGFSPLHPPHYADSGEHDAAADDELEFHPVLTAAQCVIGPCFCAYTIFGGTTYVFWVMLAAAVLGLVGATAVLRLATDGTAQPWRLIRCFAGFVCSMVWIAGIADQVVSVLDAVGEILGLSDAIVGLTIFAVGNSLADLVANMTVAQFAPAMAYAACFGGPMLNLLLGIGGSGTYAILRSPARAPVQLVFSPTLVVSAAGLVAILLATAVAVPLNGFLIDRRWAAVLLAAYAALMVANVVVEVKTGRA